MDIGTGITIGCVILGGVATAFKLLSHTSKKGNNPGTKYLLIDVFEEHKEGVNQQLKSLIRCTGEMKDSIKRVHDRVDKLLEK